VRSPPTGDRTVVDQTASAYVALTRKVTDSPSTSTLNLPRDDIRAKPAAGPVNTDGTLNAHVRGKYRRLGRPRPRPDGLFRPSEPRDL
jgi:hypothetical protein